MNNLELNEQEQLNQQKASLLDDLVAVSTVLELSLIHISEPTRPY